MSATAKLKSLAPGLGASLACAVVGTLLAVAFERSFGHQLLEPLVLALLLGLAWRNTRGLPKSATPGVKFAAKEVLEVAVVLLGASVDFRILAERGPLLVVAVGLVVAVTIALTAKVGVALGLPANTATLVGVGHGICGNSAIAAVAPVIGAKEDEIAASIGFTAVLSIVVVLLLPLLQPLLGLTDGQYGVVAGMVVYAVPQVLAATFAVSPQSVAVATLVKLTRVLFLSPVVLYFGWRQQKGEQKLAWKKLLPWFMIGFFVLATLRTLGVIAPEHGDVLRTGGKYLTVVAMGAIGLGVDLKALAGHGPRLVATVLVSLVFLVGAGLVAAYALGLG